MHRCRFVLPLAFTAGLLLLTLPWTAVRADAIDGHWCSDDGRLFSIAGSKIVTPAGITTYGNYSRHAFSYEIPAVEANGGATIFMDLLNEETLNLSLGARPGNSGTAIEVWRRCQAQTS